MCVYQKRYGRLKAPEGSCVAYILRFCFGYGGPPIEFKTAGGELVALNHVKKISIWDDSVSFNGEGNSFTKQRHTETGEIYRLYAGPAPVVSLVDKAWLDQQNPGWFERYTMAHELGAAAHECALSVFDCYQPSTDAQLPNDFGM